MVYHISMGYIMLFGEAADEWSPPWCVAFLVLVHQRPAFLAAWSASAVLQYSCPDVPRGSIV